MKDGIYHVRFSSNMRGVGEGIAVFKAGAVNGGDSGYTYSGTLATADGGFSARLTIKRWDPSSESIFGGLDQFELEFRGSDTTFGFSAKGSIVGHPEATLAVDGRYLTPAA
ncbi:GrlR family regulatory protein [Stenotrophomonas sp.]|uniref:GrlR family regulatory protein n=1 Tax=Stenotrophomonas sp. TaxID=69392 RepID=UPI0025884E7C|nr:GrlR family regulatory protein [Stenotrophomonas sp.]MCR1572641.1 hypothetical protein [Stenotrophomonas sp.]